ncbi:hypothetical protein G9A89_008092 [Geosiphon pyriformis]|nr:hypothetical protein G9A89_008092 [Geosiphon pyriformis]
MMNKLTRLSAFILLAGFCIISSGDFGVLAQIPTATKKNTLTPTRTSTVYYTQTETVTPPVGTKGSSKTIIIGVVVGVGVAIFAALLFWKIYKRHKKVKTIPPTSSETNNELIPGGQMEYKLKPSPYLSSPPPLSDYNDNGGHQPDYNFLQSSYSYPHYAQTPGAPPSGQFYASLPPELSSQNYTPDPEYQHPITYPSDSKITGLETLYYQPYNQQAGHPLPQQYNQQVGHPSPQPYNQQCLDHNPPFLPHMEVINKHLEGV